MEQIPKLGIQPAELPEEALTQIYQVWIPRIAATLRVRRKATRHDQHCRKGLQPGYVSHSDIIADTNLTPCTSLPAH